MSEKVLVHLSVHLLLLKEDNILLLERFNTGYEDGNYSLIAGHVEKNESVTTAMIREAYEEAGIGIDKKDLEVIHVMHRKKKSCEYIDYFYKCNKWEGKVVNTEPHKCKGLKWFHINNLPENIISYILFAIEEYKKASKFSEFAW